MVGSECSGGNRCVDSGAERGSARLSAFLEVTQRHFGHAKAPVTVTRSRVSALPLEVLGDRITRHGRNGPVHGRGVALEISGDHGRKPDLNSLDAVGVDLRGTPTPEKRAGEIDRAHIGENPFN